MIAALKDGFAAVGRNWGLPLLLLGVNLASAAALAVPLAGVLEAELRHKDAAANMMYGFDYPWWSEWHERQQGFAGSLSPEIFGIGFAFRNMELLLKGALPAGLLARPGLDPSAAPELDAVLLALGAGYLLLQVFLTGGVLGVLRAPAGGWTARGLLHGSGFYFGRLLRLALVSLAVLWVVFRLYWPFAAWVDDRAREAVSERTAMAWLLGRHALLLLLVLFQSMVAGYAKAMIVLEERSSALLAWLSALAFCLRHPARTTGHYAAVALGAVLLLLLWHALDGAWTTVGYRTQLPTLLLLQAFVLGRIVLRLGLLGGQLALYRRSLPGAMDPAMR